VQVWFGEHIIAEYTASHEAADRYAIAMQRRFGGLRVTTQRLDESAAGTAPLPAEHWWAIPPT